MPDIKLYVSAKIVKAYRDDKKDKGAGFSIIYPDGYKSWCPYDVFVKTYREIGGELANLEK